MSKEKFEMRLNERRDLLLEQVEDRIGSRIPYDGRARAVEEALKLGLKYLDRLEEAEQAVEGKEDEIAALKEKWETSNITLQDD